MKCGLDWVALWAACLVSTCFINLVALQAQTTTPARFKIVDTSENEMEITDLDFDYTSYPGFGLYTPDHERSGFRIRQGEGQVTVRWLDIVALKVESEPIYYVWREGNRIYFAASEKNEWEEAKNQANQGWGETYKYTASLDLVSGTIRTVELIPVSRDLAAKTELGDYRISLAKVKEIRPVR